ncbi:MAG: threonylcarbamoyl-AMP synthase [Bacteroidetes bacterium]|nr:threonylcarbamoyl-AMP synthase [Bacteroidota bacterium]
MSEFIKLYQKDTNVKILRSIVEKLERGAIIIYPTDTTYAMGCSLNCVKTINKLKRIKGKDDDNLSIICSDLSDVTNYARIDNQTYKVLRNNAPGAVTFILQATNAFPNNFLDNKKSIGIRIPSNNIVHSLVEELGFPLVSTSVPLSVEEYENEDEPSLIWDKYKNVVDIVIDGGDVPNEESTIVDFTTGEMEITRQGAVEIK